MKPLRRVASNSAQLRVRAQIFWRYPPLALLYRTVGREQATAWFILYLVLMSSYLGSSLFPPRIRLLTLNVCSNAEHEHLHYTNTPHLACFTLYRLSSSPARRSMTCILTSGLANMSRPPRLSAAKA